MKKLVTLALLLLAVSAPAQFTPSGYPLSRAGEVITIRGTDAVAISTSPGSLNVERLRFITYTNLYKILTNSFRGELLIVLDTRYVAQASGVSSNQTLLGAVLLGSDWQHFSDMYVNANSTIHFQPGGGAILDGGSSTIRCEIFLHGTNAFIRFDEDAAIEDSTATKFWKFNRFTVTSNNVATLGDATNIVNNATNGMAAITYVNGLTNNVLRNIPGFLATNSVIVVDLSRNVNAFLCSTAINYNVSIRVTNLTAGRWANISILGPAGSNAVSWIWEPWVLAKWPVDQFTDLPVTNNYVRTNCYLEVSFQAYDTNQVRVAGRMFK